MLDGSRNLSSGTSPVHRYSDDRPPSPRTSRHGVRIQTPSVAVSREGGAGKKSAATSDSPPRGRTMTRSASRGASPAVSMGKSRRSAPRDPNIFDPYEQLDADYPDRVRAPTSPPSVPRG